jgi:RNA polymerase primary sigma factor
MEATLVRNDKNALSDYLRSLYNVEPLTLEEEESLSRRIQAGDEMALEKLIKHNLRFVVSVIKNTPAWHHGSMPMEDLLAMGNEALLKAGRRWVPKNNSRFATYAVNFILKDVRRGIDNYGNLIRIPVNVAEEIRKMKYTERVLSQKLGREPRSSELADELEIHEKRVTKLKALLLREPVSLDTYNQEKFQEESDE